ncbi:MAG: prolipoprotein diacylglyceryl transferase [Nanoarchaeota archaeon]|nr:prolipoprotein diacylglyceryl transferase [Nanoarchaeota archaeon]MBU0962942.1 prolipoprotein diacylglyceryl transferase [Nanoarchaeota archaeon]
MDPIAFNLGPLTVRWYGILMFLGFVIGYFILKKLAKEKNINEKLIDDYFFYILIGTIVGARLFEVLFYDPLYYLSNPIKIFYIWEGGLASHGAIIIDILITIWFCKKNKIKFYDLADIVVIPFALGAAFIRIGNFINQELIGKVTDSIFGYKFDNYPDLRYPVQLFQSFTNFLLFIILYLSRSLPSGYIFWLFLFLYSIFRFVTEFFKDFPFLYDLTLAQYLSIPIFTISLYFLIKLKNERFK